MKRTPGSGDREGCRWAYRFDFQNKALAAQDPYTRVRGNRHQAVRAPVLTAHVDGAFIADGGARFSDSANQAVQILGWLSAIACSTLLVISHRKPTVRVEVINARKGLTAGTQELDRNRKAEPTTRATSEIAR